MKSIIKPIDTRFLLPLNLQHFAEGEGEGDGEGEGEGQGEGGTPPTGDNTGEGNEPPATFTLTEQELNDRLQKEGDRRATAAAKKREEALRKEMAEQIKIERKEAEQLAKLSADERAKVEAEKRELELKKREDELLEKERQFQRKQLELDTANVMRERKLPIRFAKLVLGEDAESTLENIVVFSDEWQQELEAEVNKRLASGTPIVGSKQTGSYNPWKKDSFNLTEQGRILMENPELAKKLKSQAGK